jgi:hypothetical protein
VVDAIAKTPYRDPSSGDYLWRLPYPDSRPRERPVRPNSRGDFDYLKPASRPFPAAAAYASVRCVLEIWEFYLGRRISLVGKSRQRKFEVIPRVTAPVPATYPLSSLRSLETIFARLPAREPVWCGARSGSGSTGAIPVMRPEQARSWIAYWSEMLGVPPTSFILSEYLPGRDFSCQAVWKAGTLVLVKTCERLSYFGGGGNPSGTSSISQLANTVFAPEVVAVCTAAIRAIDPHASGTFNFDLRENSRGVPCLTEINADRFPSGTSIFDLTGRSNLAAAFVRVALDEPVRPRETYDPAQGYYTVRDLDTLTGVFHADELFDKIVDARG